MGWLYMEKSGEITLMRQRKALAASIIGMTIEWYDFFLYGAMAGFVFNKLFFVSENLVLSTFLAYGTFAISFLFRPLGGIIFSHLGDKTGRKKSLIYTLFIMGIATVAIGLLPTYETIGIWAPILLILCRIIQGIGIGGEFGGAMLLAVENAPKEKMGLFGAIPSMGSPLGMLLSTLTVYILTISMSQEAFLAWGWRIPFIASAVLVFVGLWIRKDIGETPAFKEAQKKNTVVKTPLTHILKHHRKALLCGIGLKFVETGPYFIFTVFITSYVTNYLKISEAPALNAVIIGTLILTCLFPFVGIFSDRIGRKPVFILGTVLTILFAFPYFFLLSFGTGTWVMIATILGMLCWSPIGPLLGTLYSEVFSTEIRYTGISLSYMIGGAFMGTSPMIATALLGAFNGSYVPVAIFIIVLGIISLIAISNIKIEKVGESYSSEMTPKKSAN